MVTRVLALLTVLALTACSVTGGGAAPSQADPPSAAPATQGATPPEGPSPTDPSPSTSPATAGDDLAAFLAEAERLDASIRSAALRISATVGVDTITVDPATADAVTAIDPGSAFALVPAGLEPALLDAVLAVHSDLVARRAAFNRFERAGVTTTATDDYADALRCLGNGSAPAAEFPGYLASLRALAGSLPPQVPAPPDSRAAAELAVLGSWVHLGNNGCDSCGGGAVTRAPTVTWTVPPGAAATAEGDVGGISFTATYSPATGWSVSLNAC